MENAVITAKQAQQIAKRAEFPLSIARSMPVLLDTGAKLFKSRGRWWIGGYAANGADIRDILNRL